MFCDEIQPSFFSSCSWNTHAFFSSPGMCLKSVTHLPPPLSPDRMISCILFQLGISKELSFCKFCGKEELNKGEMREWVLLQKDIQNSNITHSEASSCQRTGSQCQWLFVLQTDRKGWELESLGDVSGGRKESECWNKECLRENKCWDWSE